MSIRHWLYAIAFWGCLSFGALSGAYADHHPNARAAKEQQAAAQEAQSQAPLAEHPHVKINTPSINQKECEEAEQNNEILDSCQQWRMANAADQTVDWAGRQFKATIGEILALVITIGFTAVATRAASNASSAAKDSAEIMKQQSRAYVLPERVDFIEDENLVIQVVFRNTGQTPARNCQSIISCAIGKPFKTDFPPHTASPVQSGNAGPEQTIIGLFREINGHSFHDAGDELLTGDLVFYVYGTLTYTDVFNETETVSFQYRWDPQHDSFINVNKGYETD